jgi:hypothetical protein
MAFGILRQIVAKYEMSDIFNADKSKLKLFFYTLDRLISIYLPDLHSHFKEENINSSMFCTTFFITLFTQVLQTQQSPDKIWKLKRIWDYFIVYGWKAIFKVSVILLRESEENCLQMQFEVILSQLPILPVKFIFNDSEANNIATFDKQMMSQKLRSQLLLRLKAEFEDSIDD